MVVAGPGTGKTQILAARVGYILKETDAKADNILCLTFTEAGAVAMRQRLLSFIGPDAYKVHIQTFHSFANRVIQDNLDYFNVRELDLLSELEEIELFRDLIDKAGYPFKRRSGNVYFERVRLKNLFADINKENWKVEELQAAAQAYHDEIPSLDEFQYKRANKTKGIKVGDPKEAQIRTAQNQMKTLLTALDLKQEYDKLKSERKRFTYDDMIAWVIEAFEKSPDILAGYQERFHYYLVDEFQDTNGSQNKILSQLSSYWDTPNLFVVGDDDQAIYRFQGASIENILDFNSTYGANTQFIPLEQNYRSSQVILDRAKALIEVNEESLSKQLEGLEKKIVASNPEVQDLKQIPRVLSFPNVHYEAYSVGKEIYELHSSKGVPYKDIAVIYRNHSQVEFLASYLRALQVPLNIKRKVNILEEVFTQNLLSLLSYLNSESKEPYSADHILFKLLHFGYKEVPAIAAAKLAYSQRDKKFKDKKPWREMIQTPEKFLESTLFQSEASPVEKIRSFSIAIESCLEKIHQLKLPDFFVYVLQQCDVLGSALRAEDKINLLEEIQTLLRFVREEFKRNPKLNLNTLLANIELMHSNGITLEMNKILASEDGVNLVTAHGSKGLEFPHVYILGCNDKNWKASKGGNQNFKLPPDAASRTMDSNLEEERRLFFVAMTRAKSNLSMTFPIADLKGKELVPTRFFAEIAEEVSLPTEHILVKENDLLEYQIKVLGSESVVRVQTIDQAYLRKIVDKTRLSATAISNYLKCPVSYYYEKVLRVPQSGSPAMAYGSAMHKAIEEYFVRMLAERNFGPADQLLEFFEQAIFAQRYHFNDEEFDRFKDKGLHYLKLYHSKYIETWAVRVELEKGIFNAVFEDIPLTGFIDKLEFISDTLVRVVDYKTGSYKSNKKFKKFLGPTGDPEAELHNERVGGDYWRQANFYKILIESSSESYAVSEAVFDFVEPEDEEGNEFFIEKIELSKEAQSIVKEQIRQVWKGIQNLEFSEGCNEEHCRWCNFVKNNQTQFEEPSDDAEHEHLKVVHLPSNEP